MMDDFEKANPGIKVKLLSGPFASTKEQTIAGAATGKLADVVGLDGAWVSDFAKQGAITDLSQVMTDAGYDQSQLAAQIKVENKAYMIPVLNFVYPLFTNDSLLTKAGVNTPPATRTEFLDAAKKISALGGDVKGWALPLSLEAPNGVQNDVMSWNWASGGTMLKDGKPDVTNADVKGTVDYVKSLWDAHVIAPGSFTMKEQDKVENFTNGRVGMMIDSLAHVTLIRKNSPDLKFSISAIPAKDGFTGKRGIPYASWASKSLTRRSTRRKHGSSCRSSLSSRPTPNSPLSPTPSRATPRPRRISLVRTRSSRRPSTSTRLATQPTSSPGSPPQTN